MTSASLHTLESVGSTQDECHRLAAEGAPDGTAVWARRQSAGRGSRGRPWRSPEGGLWLSVLRRSPAPGLDCLSLRVGLAVAAVLETVGRVPPIALKWPNDLVLRDRKVGGILCEARWQGDRLGWVAVGLGLNVANPAPADLEPPATALVEHDPSLTLERVLPPVLAALRSLPIERDRLSPEELEAFARRDWLRGRRLLEPAPGIAAGVGPDGALLIDGEAGGRASHAVGTVRLAARSPRRPTA